MIHPTAGRCQVINTKKLSLIAILSALTIAVSYAKGLGLALLPGVVEFMTVLIFVSGFYYGVLVGGSVGFVALVIYMLIPFPFAHPAAWLFTISPVLLGVMAALGVMFGIAGAVLGEILDSSKIDLKFIFVMGLAGFGLTFAYDVLSSVGFYLAYPVYSSVWEAIYLTFVPLYYPYPPIIHTVTNTAVFVIIAPALILSLKRLQV